MPKHRLGTQKRFKRNFRRGQHWLSTGAANPFSRRARYQGQSAGAMTPIPNIYNLAFGSNFFRLSSLNQDQKYGTFEGEINPLVGVGGTTNPKAAASEQ